MNSVGKPILVMVIVGVIAVVVIAIIIVYQFIQQQADRQRIIDVMKPSPEEKCKAALGNQDLTCIMGEILKPLEEYAK